MVYFRSAPLSSPGLKISRLFPGFPVINHDANSTPPLKGKHHMAVWSLCLNTLTDSPTQGLLSCLCCVSPPAYRLARCPLTMTDLLVYHLVYSYVTTSKNVFVPCSNSGHTTCPNTDNMGKLSSLRLSYGLRCCHGFCFCSCSHDKFVITYTAPSTRGQCPH